MEVLGSVELRSSSGLLQAGGHDTWGHPLRSSVQSSHMDEGEGRGSLRSLRFCLIISRFAKYFIVSPYLLRTLKIPTVSHSLLCSFEIQRLGGPEFIWWENLP
jgi:hypothetical protein